MSCRDDGHLLEAGDQWPPYFLLYYYNFVCLMYLTLVMSLGLTTSVVFLNNLVAPLPWTSKVQSMGCPAVTASSSNQIH